MVYVFKGVAALQQAGLAQQVWQLRYSELARESSLCTYEQGPDGYDTDHAHYLVSFREDGSIKASLRLIPTDSDYAMANEFKELVSPHRPYPSGPSVMEMGFYTLNPALRYPLAFLRAFGELFCALFEYACQEGWTTIISVVDEQFLLQMLEMNWPVRPLGLPRAYKLDSENAEEARLIGIAVCVVGDVINNTALACGITLPALQYGPCFDPKGELERI